VNEWLPRFGVHRPVTVFALFIAHAGARLRSRWRASRSDAARGLRAAVLWVRVPFEDASPARPTSSWCGRSPSSSATLPGLSSCAAGRCRTHAGFSLEFHPSVDMDDAYNDVVDRLERAMPDLPEEIERYWVFKYNPSDEPILWAGVTFPDSVEDPYALMERVVRPRLERINGVASMDVWGVNSRAIYIDWARDALLSHGVDLGSVQSSLARDNFQRSGGQLEEEGLVRHVRSLARIDGTEALERYPIQRGRLVLSDVAEVSLPPARRRRHRPHQRPATRRRSAFARTARRTRSRWGPRCRRRSKSSASDPRAEGAEFLLFFSQGEQIRRHHVGSDHQRWSQGGVLSVLVLLGVHARVADDAAGGSARSR
jgi:HAE1 family hydrophobic/amphiphilic exporter-1